MRDDLHELDANIHAVDRVVIEYCIRGNSSDVLEVPLVGFRIFDAID